MPGKWIESVCRFQKLLLDKIRYFLEDEKIRPDLQARKMYIAVFEGSESLVIVGRAWRIENTRARAILESPAGKAKGHFCVEQQEQIIPASRGTVNTVTVPIEILKITVIHRHESSGHLEFSFSCKRYDYFMFHRKICQEYGKFRSFFYG